MSGPAIALFLVIRSRNNEGIMKKNKIVAKLFNGIGIHISTKRDSVPIACAQNNQMSTLPVLKNYDSKAERPNIKSLYENVWWKNDIAITVLMICLNVHSLLKRNDLVIQNLHLLDRAKRS